MHRVSGVLTSTLQTRGTGITPSCSSQVRVLSECWCPRLGNGEGQGVWEPGRGHNPEGFRPPFPQAPSRVTEYSQVM